MPETIKRSWFAPSLQGYQGRWLRADVIAGIATGTVVIPQAMAYATIAGMPVQIGLYTCMLPMLVYALLGGSRALSVSTTSTIAVLVAATLAGLPGDRDADQLMKDAFTLTFLVGVCLLLMRLLRLGGLIEIISPATMTGIKTGVGLTVAVSQLPALLGIVADPDADGFFSKLRDVVSNLGDANTATVLVSAGSIAILLVLRRVAPTIPGPLLAVVAGIAIVAFTDVEQHGLALIDKVPTGLPSVSTPVFDDIGRLLPGAIAIAVMAFLETVLVARTNRHRDEPAIDTDQELLAVGVASMAGGLTQSLPPAGGFSQSAVNLRSGAKTQLAQIVTAVLAVLVALLLAPLLDDLPSCVLAAMVMVAVLGLIDLREFTLFAAVDRRELWVAVATAVVGLVGGLLLAVAVGIALTFMLVVRALNQPRLTPWVPAPGDPLEVRLAGSVYTGNAQSTTDAILERSVQAGATTVVLDCELVAAVTIPFVEMLSTLDDKLTDAGGGLEVKGLSPALSEVATKAPAFQNLVQRGRVHSQVKE